MTIIKMLNGDFAVRTGQVTSDGREIAALCYLSGDVLRTRYEAGTVCLTPIEVRLGPVALVAVMALKPTESYEAVR